MHSHGVVAGGEVAAALQVRVPGAVVVAHLPVLSGLCDGPNAQCHDKAGEEVHEGGGSDNLHADDVWDGPGVLLQATACDVTGLCLTWTCAE